MKKALLAANAALTILFLVFLAACEMPARPQDSLFSPAKPAEPEPPPPLPGAPGKPQIEAGDGIITVRWNYVDEAKQYKVYHSATTTPPTEVTDTIENNNAMVLNGLINKTTYYIWIKSVNENGTSDYSLPGQGTPWPSAESPQAPQQVRVTTGIEQLTVSWEAAGGAKTYAVYISTTATPEPSQPTLDGITGTSATLNGLANGTAYYIWVKAVNDNGISAFSAMKAGVPKAPAAKPANPGQPDLSPGSKKIDVSWHPVEMASTYEVWMGTSSNSGSAIRKAEVTDSSNRTTLTGLANEQVYYIWIIAKNGLGSSGFSSVASAKPSASLETPAVPAVPTVISGNRELTVRWSAVEGASAYELYKGTANNPGSAEMYAATITSTSATITGLANGTTVYVWIKAKNSIGTSGFSPSAGGTPSAYAAPPAAPASAPEVTEGSGRLMISWQAVTGALSYEVWAGTSSNPQNAAQRGAATTELSAVITGLNNNTTYYIWTKAKNDAGTSGFSPSASGTPSAFSSAPNAPASAPGVTVSNGALNLTWAAVSGVMSYQVFYSESNSSSGATQYGGDITNSLSVNMTGLTNGTTYYVWLKAKNDAGISGFSPVASGKPIANAAAPTLTAGTGQLGLSWAAIIGADSYDIYYSTGENPPEPPTQAGFSGTSTTITGLVNGTPYKVWVRGKNSTGTGAMSPASSGTPVAALGAVTVNAGNGQLVLTWSAAAGASQYEVYHSTSSSMPGSPTQTVSTTTATISSLTNGTTYYVWVKPKNANGTGTASAAASGKPIGNMGAVTVTAGTGQLGLAWSAVAGADQYEVYYSIVNTMPTNAAQTVNGGTSATITGLNGGTAYYVWAKPKNANGTGAESTAASGTPLGVMGTVTVTSGDGQLVLTWSAVAGASQYEVYYDTSSSMPGSPTQTVSGTTATISSLTNGTTYYVWVKPKNTIGSGTASIAVSGIPIATPNALVLNVSPELPGQIEVSWSAVTGATQYEVYYGTTEPPTTLYTTTGSTSATISGLTNGTEYKVRLRAKNSGSTSNYGASAAETAGGSPGLYKGTAKIGNQNLADALAYISTDAANGDNYYIIPVANETASNITLYYSGNTVGITMLNYGAEKTISFGASAGNFDYMFTIRSGVTLTLTQNITLAGRSTQSTSVVNINRGTLIMNNDSKIWNNQQGNGVDVNGGTFTMNGGVISGNSNNGVTVGSGTFTMNGGAISGNNSSGVVTSSNGTFTMNSGTISNNKHSGVYMLGGISTMNSGTISSNTSSYGGGVNIIDGTFTMNSGAISSNVASMDGGGVNITNGTFTMNGGTISGNTAGWGGGVAVSSTGSGTFTKLPAGGTDSGIIYDSEASGNDGNGKPLKNTATVDPYGHTVFVNRYPRRLRNTTAGQTDQIDTSTGNGLSATGNAPFGN